MPRYPSNSKQDISLTSSIYSSNAVCVLRILVCLYVVMWTCSVQDKALEREIHRATLQTELTDTKAKLCSTEAELMKANDRLCRAKADLTEVRTGL